MDNNLRCKCGKIVCQLENQTVLIRCRHCKREIILEFNKPEEHEDSSMTDQKKPKIQYR